MAIQRRQISDPLCAPPDSMLHPPVLAASSAAEREFEAQVRQYCERLIAGRSILIGGERGSGKTTLARGVIDRLRRDQQLAKSARPLFVPIHGPDFFDGPDTAHSEPEPAPRTSVLVNCGGATEKPAAAAEASPRQAAKKRRDEVRFALRVLTIALHRAFMTELGWELEGAVDHGARNPELHEMVAQLRLNLDGAADLSALRHMWSTLGRLETGLLSRDQVSGYFTNQGLLEIVAAQSLIDGYLRVAGKVEDLKQNAFEAELKQKSDSDQMHKLVNSVAGALSGGGAGAGIFATSHTGSQALLGALAIPIVAFLTTLLLNVATSRSRSLKYSEERKISFDRSVESLDLVFPLLVNRVLDAGLAPIFVVDELDKLEDTVEASVQRLDELIPRLKHIVADKAFFCFLVDRQAYDLIAASVRADPYSRRATFFPRRLYTNHTARDWRNYLVGEPPAGASLIEWLRQEDKTKALLYSDASREQRGTDATYLFEYSYFVLARSRMHAGTLQRVLRETLNTKPEELGQPFYRNYIVYQAAVEEVLEGTELSQRVEREPELRQELYRVLYRPLEFWESRRFEFTLDDLLSEKNSERELLERAVRQLLGLLEQGTPA